jgi:acyl phosphate:glycerol-3-phosphate acyltransferase
MIAGRNYLARSVFWSKGEYAIIRVEVPGMSWMQFTGALVLAYLLGSIPTGYIVAKLIKNIDIRTIGSGHTGGTNVLRSAGVLPATLTVLGDFAKGYGAVALAHALIPGTPWGQVLAGIAAVVGHNWPIFLGFHGGVGTMTSVGVALALMPIAALSAGIIAILVIVVTRYASAGSLTMAGLLSIGSLVGVALGAWPLAYALFALGTSAMSVWKLRPNIKRLCQGTERKVGEVAPSVPPQPPSSSR